MIRRNKFQASTPNPNGRGMCVAEESHFSDIARNTPMGERSSRKKDNVAAPDAPFFSACLSGNKRFSSENNEG